MYVSASNGPPVLPPVEELPSGKYTIIERNRHPLGHFGTLWNEVEDSMTIPGENGQDPSSGSNFLTVDSEDLPTILVHPADGQKTCPITNFIDEYYLQDSGEQAATRRVVNNSNEQLAHPSSSKTAEKNVPTAGSDGNVRPKLSLSVDQQPNLRPYKPAERFSPLDPTWRHAMYVSDTVWPTAREESEKSKRHGMRKQVKGLLRLGDRL